MFIYIVVLLFLFILAQLNIKRKQYVVICFLPLLLLSGLRASSVGNDAFHYTQLFQMYSQIAWGDVFSQTIEPGFVVFCKAIGLISQDHRWFILVSSAVIIVLVARFVYRNSTDIGLSAFLFISYYFLFYSFSAIRQYIAIAIVLNAYSLFKDKKLFKGIIVFLLAVSFHYSALLVFPAIIALHLKYNKKNICILISICIAVVVLFRTVAIYIINNTQRFFYYRDDIDSFVGRGWDINVLLYVFLFIIIIFGLHILKKNINYSTESFSEEIICSSLYYDLYSYLICIMMALALYLVSVSMTMAARANHYYAVFLIVYIPVLISTLNNSMRRLFKLSICILFFIYCVLMLSHNNYYVVPYELGF